MSDDATFAEERAAEEIARSLATLQLAILRALPVGLVVTVTAGPNGCTAKTERIVVAPKFKPILGVP